MAAASANQFEEALQNALKAIEIDKNFGLGYLIAANQSANLGRSADERKYLELAMQHLDGMTDRERYHTRGAYRPGDQRLPAVRQGIQRRDRAAIAPTSPGATSSRCASRICARCGRPSR